MGTGSLFTCRLSERNFSLVNVWRTHGTCKGDKQSHKALEKCKERSGTLEAKLRLRFIERDHCYTQLVSRLVFVRADAPSSVEVLEDVPLHDGLARLGKHFIPVLHLYGAALGAEHQLSDGLVATHAVVVHDADHQRRLSDALVRHVERERVVERWIQRLLLHLRLLLLRLLALVHHPDLHVRICSHISQRIVVCVLPQCKLENYKRSFVSWFIFNA